MLSKSCKYAIRAVLYLAQNPIKKIGAKQIALALNIPAPFLAKTLQELTKRGIISSVKGPNGGFFISEKNRNSKIVDIVTSIEGESVFNQCFIGNPECNSKRPCNVHHLYVSFKKQLFKNFFDKSLSAVIDDKSFSIDTLLQKL